MTSHPVSSFPVDISKAGSSTTLRLLSSAVTSLHLALGQCATLLQLAADGGEITSLPEPLNSFLRAASQTGFTGSGFPVSHNVVVPEAEATQGTAGRADSQPTVARGDSQPTGRKRARPTASRGAQNLNNNSQSHEGKRPLSDVQREMLVFMAEQSKQILAANPGMTSKEAREVAREKWRQVRGVSPRKKRRGAKGEETAADGGAGKLVRKTAGGGVGESGEGEEEEEEEPPSLADAGKMISQILKDSKGNMTLVGDDGVVHTGGSSGEFKQDEEEAEEGEEDEEEEEEEEEGGREEQNGVLIEDAPQENGVHAGVEGAAEEGEGVGEDEAEGDEEEEDEEDEEEEEEGGGEAVEDRNSQPSGVAQSGSVLGIAAAPAGSNAGEEEEEEGEEEEDEEDDDETQDGQAAAVPLQQAGEGQVESEEEEEEEEEVEEPAMPAQKAVPQRKLFDESKTVSPVKATKGRNGRGSASSVSAAQAHQRKGRAKARPDEKASKPSRAGPSGRAKKSK